MSSRKYDDLLTLKQARSDWKIKVRVIRTWRGATKTGESYKSFNVMLMDHQETKIHVFVPAKCADALENKLRDIREVEERTTTIPNESFDFYDHTDLDTIKNLNVYLTDVIGIIQRNEDITLKDLVNSLGQKNLRTKFSITNGSSNVKVTFWDALAKSFVQQLKLQPLEDPVIIIITSCKVGNEVDLSNAGATTFYLNYQHHSVAEMRKMLANPNFHKQIQNAKMKPQLLKIGEIKKN
ncbi:hypothetical protein POM88_020778 [Heracleum sosnowskyi]|uniref:Replication protein A 70 kDa DNA-binding subunit B/D first OB fold domain-containing protein n=1 Tax=Heracleum sosnowskyi TaxID=360622 RepID=A0AAD8MT70_9APIA|nr:hypothetical protein POM88_020778 [Heracleum sosnowskyi]